jgi:hypothetical protein
MNKGKMLTLIRGEIDANAALRNLEGMTAHIPVVERSVLYPYSRFTATCEVPTMIGRKSMTMNCLVDDINGHAATADDFATDTIDSLNETCLQAAISDDDAKRAARRTVAHRLGKRLRVIAPFNVQLESAGKVYRRFWIIRIGGQRIMTDSVTGGMHPLDASAA